LQLQFIKIFDILRISLSIWSMNFQLIQNRNKWPNAWMHECIDA
jgi:hypothetical protein